MRLKPLLITFLILPWLIGSAYSQKIVGYIQSTTYFTSPPAGYLSISQVQFDKVTDVVFCFLNPGAAEDGSLQLDRTGSAEFDFEMDKFLAVKAKCYPMVANGPRLWIAVGGASGSGLDGPRPTRLATVCNSDAKRTTFANNLINFAIEHELEGIDIDWEFPNTGTEVTYFSAFILKLKAQINTLKPTLKISVAVGGETSGGCVAEGSTTNHMGYFPASPGNASVLAALDYVYIMAYDLPASYNANHSAAADGATSMSNWNSCRGIPFSKMCLGIPFYGKSNPRGTTINYNSLAAGAWSSDGPSSGVYYNGQPAINAKITSVRNTTYNAAGVVLWDIAQDKSGAESLLSYINSRMFGNTNSTNPCSTRPFIGKDTTLCVGSSITLNSGVTTTGGTPNRTFTWYRNGASLGAASATQNTQSITQSGTYTVVVTQQANPAGTNAVCSIRDTIIVSEQPDVTGVSASNPTVCSTGSPTSTDLSGTSTGTVQWYTSSTSGASVATGSPVTVSPTATTTYYAQASAVPNNKVYYGGRPFLDNSTSVFLERTADEDGMGSRPDWVQRLTVLQPLTLKSVYVYFSSSVAHSPVRIMILDATQPATSLPVATTASVTVAAHPTAEPVGYPTKLTVNVTLQPGTYYVGIYNSDGAVAPEYAVIQSTLSYPTSYPNVFSIDGTAYRNNGTSYGATGNYGQLFDWRFESASLSQCTRKQVTVTHDCPAPVNLSSFSGYNNNQKNYLYWSTAQEENNDFFRLEKSADGVTYTELTKVVGAGTTSEIQRYSHIDDSPFSGATYYRLVQVDLDRTETVSGVIVINSKEENYIEIMPNPFEDELVVKISGEEKERLVQIVHIEGKVAYETVINSGSEILNFGNAIAPGMYFVKILDGESIYTYPIVKR